MKWGYKKAFLRCALLLIAGAVFQFIFGGIDNSILLQPWGLVLAINYLYLLILAYAKSDKWAWVKRLYDHPSMVSVLVSMIVLCLILGLSGNMNLISSWPFCLILIYFITALGLRCIDEIHHWRQRRIIPTISHAAVFLVLAAGLFSSGEKTRVRIQAPIGYPVHIGTTVDSKEVRLPFVITLKDFNIKEYAPKLHLINPQEGLSSEEFIVVEEDGTKGRLEDWDVQILSYIDMAGRLKDSTDYKEMEHVGATSAAYIAASNIHTGQKHEGWVSCGSHIFPPSMLQLNETQAIAMPKREPEHYLSEVIIIDDKGEKTFNIEVNKPAKVGVWRIYQLSYDTERGKWSTYSVFECVKDGWYPLIQTGLWLILASGVAMALTAGRGRNKKEVQS